MKKLTPVSPGSNAFYFSFDPKLLRILQARYLADLGGFFKGAIETQVLNKGLPIQCSLNSDYYLASYGNYPLFWVSNNNQKTYQIFEDFFRSVKISKDIKQLVKYQKNIILYCGFFVIGNQAPFENWHVDFLPGANAYTLITPLFDLNPGHGHLWYRDIHEKVSAYTYKMGEAIVLGDGFYHSTEPYEPHSSARVLLSMTFGTDSYDYWPQLQHALTGQSIYFKLPCGHMIGSCMCAGQFN